MKIRIAKFQHIQNCLPVLLTLDDEEDIRMLFASLLKYAAKEHSALTAITLLNEYIEDSEGVSC